MSTQLPPATEVGDACVPNIGPLGRRRRMRFGVEGLVIGALLAAGLVVFARPRWTRLLVLPVFWAAATGIFQAREKT